MRRKRPGRPGPFDGAPRRSLGTGAHRSPFETADPMPKFLTLDDIEPSGKRVLLRADLNVPVKDGRVTDATRIERLVPTIRQLAERGAKVVVMSHFGRPKGKRDEAF